MDEAEPGEPLDVSVEAFFAMRRPRKDSAHTTAAYRRDLAVIAGHIAQIHGKTVAELRIDHLSVPVLREAFGAFADTHAKASITRCWSTWNQFFGFLVGEGIRDGNPMTAIPKPHLPKRTPKALKGENTPEILLQSAATPNKAARHPWPQRDVAVLATLLLTGVRSAELIGLTIGSIAGRPGERRIAVTGKGGKSRSVPIEESLHDVIQEYLATRRRRLPTPKLTGASPLFVDWSGEPLRRGGLQYLVRTALRRAGVSDRRPAGALVHAMRHTFATRLSEDGASAGAIMELLGHASLASSQVYISSTALEQRAFAAANRTYRALDHAATADTSDDTPLPHSPSA